ncbi:unknown protein [Seminavis robusta]|uniref:Reverse transcriptase Ty1/copia-type domain-containing protein n=1 Tax=Seminavis robusta TaxID=568900 RepID=A0A9N8HTQ3_9STRA|nr:unknown protein [Seminavis robusta]|eukprot:Sro1693_g291681.1  (300) ;mRNA; r:21118-22017
MRQRVTSHSGDPLSLMSHTSQFLKSVLHHYETQSPGHNIISLAISKGRRIKQWNAKNTFGRPIPVLPKGEEICVCIPPKGCRYSKPGSYWRLKKTSYGLHSSPRHWYQTFCKVLASLEMEVCKHDPCVFVGKSPSGGNMTFGTYIDDCLYWGTNEATETWFEKALGKQLKIDFMGDLSFYFEAHYDLQTLPDCCLRVHCSPEGHLQKMLNQHSMLAQANGRAEQVDATLPPTDRWRLHLDYREINLNLSLPKTLRWLDTIKLARAAYGRLSTTYHRRTTRQLQQSMHNYPQTGRTTTQE